VTAGAWLWVAGVLATLVLFGPIPAVLTVVLYALWYLVVDLRARCSR